ncbi:hypothetical protein AFLA70_213g001481 [Aspergillus flavus AF70]|nr:hypothetical protein AFLA70_213g001481 [Aspergillus flavus AF70]
MYGLPILNWFNRYGVTIIVYSTVAVIFLPSRSESAELFMIPIAVHLNARSQLPSMTYTSSYRVVSLLDESEAL